MYHSETMAWSTLSQKLELVSVETPTSMIPLVLGINSLLDPQASRCLKKINFMSYEVAAKCDDDSELNRLYILNDYFFGDHGFQVDRGKTHEFWNFRHIIETKRGAPLPIALIYFHFAAYIDLPLYIIQLQGFRMVKWVVENQPKYINLAAGGRILSEKQVLEVLNKMNKTALSTKDKKEPEGALATHLEILPLKKLLFHYVQSLIELYKYEGKDIERKTMLDVILKISPSNLKFLSQRALLLKRMGLYKEAMADLKKYFSFTSLEGSPEEIQIAFYDMKLKNSPDDNMFNTTKVTDSTNISSALFTDASYKLSTPKISTSAKNLSTTKVDDDPIL